MAAIVVAPPPKSAFDDPVSRARVEWLIKDALLQLAKAVRDSPHNRDQVHIVLDAAGDKITRASHVQPAPRHPPE
jgi:hypothetical protein